MSEIPHKPEFAPEPKPAVSTSARELAACYARVFAGDDDGKRVFADLRKKFGTHRPRFSRSEAGRFDTIGASLIDGESRVLIEIEDAIKLGGGQIPPI